MKIIVTEFAERHFDPKFNGTKILNYTKEEFEKELECLSHLDEHDELIGEYKGTELGDIIVHEGYAPFCKLIAIPNFTDAKVGSMPITLENYPYIRSGYLARRDFELPVFSRWLELPLGKPKAKWLILVLYSYDQLVKEATETQKEVPDCDYGIVAILGQSHPNEEPMKPETMLRNALGIEEGGSGVPLDREQYLKSVDFWSKNITVK